MSIDFDICDGVALITLNRPERLNALDSKHYEALSKSWVRVRDDPAVKVAIVTGAGNRSFTAGADLKARRNEEVGEFWLTQRNQLLNRGLEVWKPVISAINGDCLGGGFTLMLATDVRLAVPHAMFGLPEVTRGTIPGNGGTQRLLSQVPYAIGMEMLLSGEPIDATTAASWGLVNRVVETATLLDEAYKLAHRIARNAPLAVQAAKELAIRSQGMGLPDGLRLERAIGQVLRSTDDAEEGRRAFREKRPPAYKGN